MNPYLDDNSAKASLVASLNKASHQVITPADVGTGGVSDPLHQIYAIGHGLVVLSRDHKDFEDLHLLIQAAGGQHPCKLRFQSFAQDERCWRV